MELLAKLTQTPSVPGREDRVREVIQKHITDAKLFDEISVDAMGNLIAVRRARPKKGKAAETPLKVMLAAHMDQIGFLVSFISEEGFLRVYPVGGFDNRNLFARKVKVCTKSGDLPGIMNPSGRPIHIASEEEKRKIPEITDFFIDLGLPGKEVKEKVQMGDMVVLDGPFSEVGNYVSSQCLDNRIGCWAQIRAIEKLKNHNCEIHAVWTVQEEVGLRGAGPATFAVEPDIGISCDTTLCCKVPGVPEEQRGTIAGDGVCLKVIDSSTIADIKLLEQIEEVAAKRNIKCQRGVLLRGGQDGAMMQRTRAGARVAIFGCPVKYIHTITEMSHKVDLESYPALLTAFLESL
ncbi:M42 family metallopeptidase [Planctomicrobium sp. SH668]|uniref:M42 family metallopeptidase n=1 Tax=Planctomicrobium sp. SH668 TaxID=3448126 RepID=UPI003F5C07D8